MSDTFINDDRAWSPARKLRAVTPNDSTDLAAGPCKALLIGGAGTISVIAVDDSSEVSLTVAAGILPVRAKRVRSTGTTATGIVALY